MQRKVAEASRLSRIAQELRRGAAATFLVLMAGCASPDAGRKITFDVSSLNGDGLRGPPDGLVAVSYEFCIPDTEAHRSEIRAIDPTVEFQGGSPGRIGCGPGQCLCIGMTHQPGFRRILRTLAQKSYIQRIDECFFE